MHWLAPWLNLSPRGMRREGIVQSEVLEVERATMMQDFAITAGENLFMDLPLVFDRELGRASGPHMPYRGSDDYGAASA